MRLFCAFGARRWWAPIPLSGPHTLILSQHLELPTLEQERCNSHLTCFCRYLLNLPGNAWSVRLKYLMLCASTVIFPTNGWEEFWYHLLEVSRSHDCHPRIRSEDESTHC